MKKVFILFIIWLLITASVPASSTMTVEPLWLPASDGLLPAVPGVKSHQYANNSVQVDVQFTGIWAQVLENEHGSFTQLSLDGYGHNGQSGQPDLPLFSLFVDIPSQTLVRLEVIQQTSRTIALSGLNLPGFVFPEQPLRSKSGEQPPWQEPNLATYSGNQFIPLQPVILGDAYQQRNHHLQPLQISPVRYNPSSGEIELLQSLTLLLTWQAPSPEEIARANRLSDPVFDQLIENNAVTLTAGDEPKLPVEGDSYLIISPDVFLTTLAPLVSLKQSQGYTVKLVSLSEIGSSSQTAIRNYILNEYQNGKLPPSYLLLVGDTNLLPAWSSSVRASMEISKKSDLYYATMNGSSDFVPDLFYGRLPARTTQQLSDMITKIQLQANLSGGESWIKKAALIASCDSGNYGLAEGTQNYVINTHTLPAGYTGTFPSNPQPGGDQLYCHTNYANTTNVTNAVNEQRALIAYSGHGAIGGWNDGTINFSSTNIRSLQTNSALPLVTSFACNTGDFGNDSTIEAFGETWILQAAKGAVAFLGSADLSYWGPDDKLERAMYDTLFATPSSLPPVGQAIFDGLEQVQAFYPTSAQYYFETYNLMGDPSTRIWLGPRKSDFSLSMTDYHLDVCSDSNTTANINVSSLESFSNPVALEILDAPAGVNGNFSSNPVAPPATTQLTLGAAHSTPAGVYDLILRGSSGNLEHSLPINLSIHSQSPLAPQPLTPPPNADPQPLLPTFSWEATSAAETYELQVALDPDFSRLIIDQPSLRVTSFTPEVELASAGIYYWRVKSANGCGQSNYSPVVIFTTITQPGDCNTIPLHQTVYASSFENNTSGWSASGWLLDSARYLSPTQSYHAIAPAIIQSQQLVSPLITIPAAQLSPSLRFWHWRDLEATTAGCYDAGILEYSVNGGSTWGQVPPAWFPISTDSYNGTILVNSSNPLAGQAGWCGNMGWHRPVVDLSAIAGQNALFRYQLASDSSVGSEGWYIDDFEVGFCQVDYQFNLETNNSGKSAEPGEIVTYSITLLNTGTLDSYQVRSTGNNWETSIAPPSIMNLDFMHSTIITIQVTIPTDASPGQTDTTTLTFTSSKESDLAHSVSLTTTAIQYIRYYLPLVYGP